MSKRKVLQIGIVLVVTTLLVPSLVSARRIRKLPSNHGRQGLVMHSVPNTPNTQGTEIPVNGTFRTPPDEFSACPDAPLDADCQIDWFFGDIGGQDQGNRRGGDDKLTTIFINENEFFGNPAPGYWTYRDLEEITDIRGIFRGYEDGVIDARPGQSNTGGFWGHYKGVTDDGCWSLEFNISGVIDLTGMIDQSANPVNSDSGVWSGKITKLCK